MENFIYAGKVLLG